MAEYFSGDTVASGRVVIEYDIRVWYMPGGTIYDWTSSTDAISSEMVFETIAEAHADARSTLGGI